LDNYDLTWAPIESLFKFLGAPFGIFLKTKDVVGFLKDKIAKKTKVLDISTLLLG